MPEKHGIYCDLMHGFNWVIVNPDTWSVALSAARVELAVDGLEAAAVHMGVDLRGGDVGVA